MRSAEVKEGSPLAKYHVLANRIIWFAVESWWRVVGEKKYNAGGGEELNKDNIVRGAHELGFSDPEQELLAFFVSDWFEELSVVAGLDWRAARRALYNNIYGDQTDGDSENISIIPLLSEQSRGEVR